MEAQPPADPNNISDTLSLLVDAVVNSAIAAYQVQDPESFVIRDELRRLPAPVMTEVINSVMIKLLQANPDICRWFILDVFLRDADPEGKADVAERINLMMASLQANDF